MARDDATQALQLGEGSARAWGEYMSPVEKPHAPSLSDSESFCSIQSRSHSSSCPSRCPTRAMRRPRVRPEKTLTSSSNGRPVRGKFWRSSSPSPCRHRKDRWRSRGASGGRRHRVGRKATVANYFRCNSLRNFLRAMFQHLKIRMAVRIDETRGDHQPVTVDCPRVDGRLESTDPLIVGLEISTSPRLGGEPVLSMSVPPLSTVVLTC